MNRPDFRYEAHKLRERALMKLVWALPREVAYRAAIRVWAHATTGPYGSTVANELTVDEALRRWTGVSYFRVPVRLPVEVTDVDDVSSDPVYNDLAEALASEGETVIVAGQAFRRGRADEDLRSGWVHQDGTVCPAFLAGGCPGRRVSWPAGEQGTDEK